MALPTLSVVMYPTVDVAVRQDLVASDLGLGDAEMVASVALGFGFGASVFTGTSGALKVGLGSGGAEVGVSGAL